jgi:hypothetical protein
MLRSSELDVPHWAVTLVNTAREVYKIPQKISDRRIYASLQYSGENKETKAQIDTRFTNLAKES